jgi:AhpC/TSA family
MSENEVLNRFPAHRLDGALRFSAHEAKVGTEAPDFALPDLGGKTVRLSGYRGKANVVLMFGSVTCGDHNSTEGRKTVDPLAVRELQEERI